MLEYNKEKGILYAYKNELARPKLVLDKQDSVVYQSFLKYINERAGEDVIETLIPALNTAITGRTNRVNNTAMLSTDLSRIKAKTVGPGKFNDNTHHLTVRFNLPNFNPNDAEDVTVVKLPTVDENGIIEWEGQQYAFIHMLEQEPAVSYEANEGTLKKAALKIKNGARSIWIESNDAQLKIKFSDRKGKSQSKMYNLIDLIVAFAKTEGYSPAEVFEEFANFNIVNIFKDADDKAQRLAGLVSNHGSVNGSDYKLDLVPRLNLTHIKQTTGEGDTSYDCSAIRPDLNELLSLDRATGEILAKDVESELNPGKIIACKGEVVDANLLTLFNAEGVYKIYVKNIPNLEGNYLAETVHIMYAPQGLRITENLRQYFPEEKGMYTSRFYDKLDHPIVYEEGEQLTSDMLAVMIAYERDTVKVSDKRTGGKIKTLHFCEEIISNRQFLGQKIGKEERKWYYLNADKKFVPSDGAYTTYDFVALMSFCVKLFEGKWIDRVTNADAGFRKVLIPLEEQYHRAFNYSVRESIKQMNRKFKEIYQRSKQNFLSRDLIDNEFYPFTKNFWKYLRDEAKCIVRLQNDNLHNPIAYQSACTKVNVYTANKHSIADSQREISIGSYGKIDAYEIPQSGKMGTVYNSCCGSVIDLEGNMRTKYYKVKPLGTKSKIITSEVYEFTSREEEMYVIADICSLDFDEAGIVQDNTKIVQCRVPTKNSVEKSTFAYRPISQVEYVNIDALQPLSYASASIPFMSSNDAARAIFAVAQEKQAKGLCVAEEPDVMTSAYEQFAWLNDKFGIIAKGDGKVVQCEYIWKDEIYQLAVIYDDPSLNNAPTNEYDDVQGKIYTFPEYFDSGYSVTKMKVLVEAGMRFKKGQMLVSSNFISENGILTLGCNALVGYICNGYNYEDGAHISNAMCERLSSYRINKEDFVGNQQSTRSYKPSRMEGTQWLSKEIGSTINVTYSDRRYLENVRKEVPLEKAYGFYQDFRPIRLEHSTGNYGVTLNTVSVDPFSRGDKNSNRHGNKGVLSKKESSENMPRLNNGFPLDICFNPLGVGSRMNIGQVKECHTGLCAHVMKYKLSADAYNSISEKEIFMLMELTVDLMNSTGDISGILAQHAELFADMKYAEDFKEHLRECISHIRMYAGCFEKDGTTSVMLPDNDGKMTETKILIGYIHVFKLIQESHKKIHARGGQNIWEPYGEVTDAPTHGSSVGGGQRFGTMEIDALCAYGVNNYIHECTNERCDNAIARDNFNIDTFLPGSIKKDYHINSSGQRRAVTQFLYSMLALGVMCEPNDDEFLPLSKDNGEELSHWKPSAIQQATVKTKNKYNNTPTVKKQKTEEEKATEEFTNATDLILGRLTK